jgi:hypothetical protein
MIGAYKPFSPSLLQENDPPARKVVREYLAKHNIKVQNHPNRFKVDLVSEDGSMFIEVEHRNVWQTKDFPFDEINVPERKAKFFTENNIHYVILSKDFNYIGLISGKALKKYIVESNLKESPNKFVRSGELFFKIPKSAFKWDKI